MGATPDDFVAPYTLSGWEADLAAWQAVTLARPEHEAMVRAAVAALLQPWLDDTSKRFQAAVQSHGLPAPADQPPIAAPSGGCLLFADGLRYDVPRQLQKELEVVGITGSLTTPNGAACFNTGGTYTYAHGGISLQECLTPVLVVSGGTSNAPAAAITEISWKGLRCKLEVSGATAGLKADLRRESISGPSVANTPKPIDDGGARLLVEDDELEGSVVMAVLISPEGRLIAQRRTVVGGDTWAANSGLVWSQQ